MGGSDPKHIAQTDRLVLRQVGPADAPFLRALLNDPSWIRNIGDRGVRSDRDAEQYIRDKIMVSYQAFGFGMYLGELKEDGSPIGLCGLVKRDSLPDPDIGFALLPGFRKRGLALEAATAVLDHAHRDVRLPRLLGIVRPDNRESVTLLERLGFHHQGAYRPPGEGQDLKLYEISL